ncbi:MAG: hypothetical protein J5851_07095 [Oscillospiraceae bacterium]|nr:hypothetical protein [Oscillospiraceae bacterium]
MTLENFRDLLLTVTPDVYHFEAHKDEEYIVWHEVGGISLTGDDRHAETGTRIAVDYYTKQEYDTLPARLSETLGSCPDIALSDERVMFEPETELIHYAYTCEVI